MATLFQSVLRILVLGITFGKINQRILRICQETRFSIKCTYNLLFTETFYVASPVREKKLLLHHILMRLFLHLLIHHFWKIWLLFPFLSPPSFSLAVPHSMWGLSCPVRDWTCFPSIGSMERVLTSGLAGKVLLFLFFSFLPYSFSPLIFFLLYQKRLFIS